VLRSGNSKAVSQTYESLIQEAKRQLASNQLQQAQATGERAIRLDGSRYEAHVIIAAALREQKKYPQATQHLQTALSLVPTEAKLDILRAVSEVRLAGLSPDERQQLDVVLLIAEDANKASTSDKRAKLLREFLERSSTFLENHSYVAELWFLRAAAAIEVDDALNAKSAKTLRESWKNSATRYSRF
jgi:tetratricopeptide (TPR) repeat protein